MTVNYGIVGTGYFGAGLARLIAELPGAKVTLVYDPKNAKNIAQELSCEIATSIEELCSSDEVDVVIIASPNGEHKQPIMLAARNKKHVFCEKPIALNLKDCNDMIQATSENNVLFMAGHIMNYMKGVRRTKQMINNGVLGEVLFCHAERTGFEEPEANDSWKKNNALSGGHLYHHIHELDLIQFLMGPAERVTMTGGNILHQNLGSNDEDDILLLNLEFPNNTFATMQYGSVFKWSEHYVKVQGTKGAILLDMQDSKMVLKTDEGVKQFILHESKEEDEDRTRRYHDNDSDGAIVYGKPNQELPLWLVSMMRNELRYLHHVVQGGEVDEEFEPLLNGTAAKDAIATADALTLSLKEDRKVSVSELKSGLLGGQKIVI